MATKDYYRGVTIQYKGEATELSAVLSQINAEMKQSQAAARALDSALKLDPKSVNLLGDRAQVAAKQVENAQKRVDALRAAMEQTTDAEVLTRLTQQADIADARLKSLKERLVSLNVSSAMESGGGLAGFAQGAQEVGARLHEVGSAAKEMGDGLTVGLTAPIVAAAAASVSAATTIDSALTDVRKTVDGTEEQYQALKDAAIEYSKTNAVTADEVLQVQALGAQLGYARDELEMIGRVGTGLDIATDMNAEQATTEMAQFANITKMAHSESENYASTVVELGNTMATTESKTSSMAQRIAAAGTQVGMSQADILGVAAALSSVGMEAEAGGTAISTIISNIDKDVATGSANLSTWAATAGMSADQFASAWKSSPVDALAAVLSGMESATQSGGNMTVMLESLGVSSIRQADAMKRLANDSTILTSAVDRANEAWRSNTALSEEVANKNDSLAAKMQMLQNRVTAIMEKVGRPLADALLAMLDAAEPLFDAIESGAQTFADMDESSQRLIVTVGAAVAALGPALSIGGRITETVGSLVGGLGKAAEGVLTFGEAMKAGFSATESLSLASETLGTTLSTGALGVGIAAVGVAIAGVVEGYRQWFEHQETLRAATDGLTGAVDGLSAAADGYQASIDGATERTGNFRDRINETIEAQAELAASMREGWEGLGTDFGALDTYLAQIEDLSGKASLSAEEMAVLNNAIEQVNDKTGASIPTLQGQADAMSLSADQIREVAEAWKQQQTAAQHTDNYNRLLEQQAAAHRELANAERLDAQVKAAGDAATQRYASTLANGAGAARGLGVSLDEARRAAASADAAVEQAKAGMATTPYVFSTVQAAMAAAGVTGEQYKSLTAQQLAQIAAAFDGTINSISAKLASFGVSVGGAGKVATNAAAKATNNIVDVIDTGGQQANAAQGRANDAAAKAQQKANDAAIKEQQKAFDRENKALQKSLAAKLKQRQKEYQREEDQQRKANEASLAEMRKANDAEEAELKASLDERYQAREKALKAETDAESKANAKRLKDLKATQAAATKAFKAETSARIKEMEREYKAQVAKLDEESGAGAIDAKIKQLEAEGAAEQQAAKSREQAEKVAELRAEVDRSKSRRRRAEAQKALNDYLTQIDEEKREADRKAEIERLNEEKARLKEETSARADELKARYEAEKEAYQTQRSELADKAAESNEAEYEKLREKLAAQLEMHKEANAQILESIAEANQLRIDQMVEAHDLEESMRKEQLDAELEQRREFNAEQIDLMRESQSEQLESQKEAQQAQIDSMREAGQAQVDAMRDAMSGAAGAISSGGGAMAAAAEDAAEDTAEGMESGLAPMPEDVNRLATDMRNKFEGAISVMEAIANATGNNSGSMLLSSFKQWSNPNVTAWQNLASSMLQKVSGLPASAGKTGSDSASSLNSALRAGTVTASASATTLMNAVLDRFTSGKLRISEQGRLVGSSFARSIGSADNRALVDGATQNIMRTAESNLSDNTWADWSGYDMVQNFTNGIYNAQGSLANALNHIASLTQSYLGHSIAKRGPLHVGGRGEAVWGEHLVDNFMRGIASREGELVAQMERMGRLVEESFAPDLSTRYDMALNASSASAMASQAAAIGSQARAFGDIKIELHLDNVNLANNMDIRDVSHELTQQLRRELALALGGGV